MDRKYRSGGLDLGVWIGTEALDPQRLDRGMDRVVRPGLIHTPGF